MDCLKFLLLVLFLTSAGWAETCTSCHRRPPTPQPFRDGRKFCSTCLSQNVFDEATSQRLLYECSTFLSSQLGGNFPVPPFQLLDEPEFSKRRVRFSLGPDIQGIYSHSDSTVYFLSGLRPANFQGLLVHEFTHAWQHRVCPRQDRALSEGFATLMQYQWLMSKGESSVARSILNNSDPDYGESCRKLLALQKSLGAPALLERVTRSRKLVEVLR